jgi:hypothetical protein
MIRIRFHLVVGSKDPDQDPSQNVTDPEHCFFKAIRYSKSKNYHFKEPDTSLVYAPKQFCDSLFIKISARPINQSSICSILFSQPSYPIPVLRKRIRDPVPF